MSQITYTLSKISFTNSEMELDYPQKLNVQMLPEKKVKTLALES